MMKGYITIVYTTYKGYNNCKYITHPTYEDLNI